MPIDTSQQTWATSKNDITGAALVSKPSTEAYSSGWDRIFGKQASLSNEDVKEADETTDEAS